MGHRHISDCGGREPYKFELRGEHSEQQSGHGPQVQMMKSVDPGRPTIVKNYVLLPGVAVQLDEIYADCWVNTPGAVAFAATKAEVDQIANVAGVILICGSFRVRRLVGVWAEAAAGAPPQNVVVVSTGAETDDEQ